MTTQPLSKDKSSLARFCSLLCKIPIVVIALIKDNREWTINESGVEGFQQDLLINNPKNRVQEVKEVIDKKAIEKLPSWFKKNKIAYYYEVPLYHYEALLGYVSLMDIEPRKGGQQDPETIKLLCEKLADFVICNNLNKQLEEQIQVLDHFLTGSSKTMAVLDATSLMFKSTNEEFYQVTGYNLKDLDGKSFADIISPPDQAEVLKILKNIKEGSLQEFDASTKDRTDAYFRFKVLKKDQRYYIHVRDITEKKKQKKELVENEERYRRLSEFAFENIAIHEMGKIVDCNLTFTKTFGYTYDEVKGMNLFHFFPRIYREILNKDASLIEDRRLETMCVRKDSSTFPAEIMIKTIANDGHVINAIAIRDNSERKVLENELLKSTVFQKAILDSSSFAIISTDFNGMIKTINKGAEKMIGIKAEEVIDKVNVVSLHDEEEIKSRAAQLSSELDKVIYPGFAVFVEKLQTLNVDENEWTYPQKNNSVIVASVTVTTLKDNFGEITGYLFMGTDISDKKKAEAEIIDKSQLLNGILSHMPVFVFKVDKNGYFTQSIGTGLNNLGLEENKLVGTNIFVTFPQEESYIEKAYAGEYVSFIHSTTINEAEYHYEYFVFPDLALRGGLIGFALNITEKIDSEQKLKSSAENLVKINKELDQFAYIVSHDLKAPLRGIAALSEYIEEDLGTEVDPEVQHNMTMLRGRAQRMQNLIDGILSYSRVGRIKVSYEEIDLNVLVKEAISVINAPETITIQVAKELPVIYSNSTWLEQIFTNLISNAIKYHDKPMGKVVIDFEQNNKFYQFSVEDDGPGIPEEFHEKVFVIFQTLEARDLKESTGVGLAIVKKIIEEHGGSIWVESDGKLGSKFIFTLPKNQVAVQQS